MTAPKKSTQRSSKPCSPEDLFGGGDQIETEDPDQYAHKIRKCGRCRNEFWSNPGGLKFIPLFCEVCAEINADILRRRKQRAQLLEEQNDRESR